VNSTQSSIVEPVPIAKAGIAFSVTCVPFASVVTLLGRTL